MAPTKVRTFSQGGLHRKHISGRTVVCRSQGFSQIASSLWENAANFGTSLKRLADDITAGEPAVQAKVNRADGASALGIPSGPTQAARAISTAGATEATTARMERSDTGTGNIAATTAAAPAGGSGSAATERAQTSWSSRGGSMKLEVQVIDSISKVSRQEWDEVVCSCQGGEVNPFLLWSFLNALEESGSACPRAGWLPQHLLVRQVEHPGSQEGDSTGSGGRGSSGGELGASGGGRLVGCVPVYLKGHSYGEYVFDSSWANYAQMLGIRYYPKLQAAVPFTPVTGPRILVAGHLGPSRRAAVVRALGRKLIDMTEALGLSGVHLTFSTAQEWAVLAELGFKQRLGVQFHWDNAGYRSFEDFLGDLKQSKRKSIRQERKSVQRAGLATHRLPGSALSAAHWDRFYSFYLSTVDRKWGNAYLTRDFFQRLGEDMPDRVLLVAASEDPLRAGSDSWPLSSSSSSFSSASSDEEAQQGSRWSGASSAADSSLAAEAPPADRLVAAALNLVGSHALFGRNWGQAEGRDYKNLHFELCYYQALEEAIARGLPRVEAGAQGEHKLQRGYLPSFTYSCHYLRDPRLGSAVDAFLRKERSQIEYTLQMMSVTGSPYKKERTVEALVSKLQAYSSLSSGGSLEWVETEEEAGSTTGGGEGAEVAAHQRLHVVEGSSVV